MAHMLSGVSSSSGAAVEQAGLQFPTDLTISISSAKLVYGIGVVPLPSISTGISSAGLNHSLQLKVNSVSLKGVSNSTGNFYLITSRFCSISGTTIDNNGFIAPFTPVTCYLKTWGKFVVTQVNSTEQITDFITTVFSNSNGHFTITLLPPGDLNPPDLYYEIDINGYIVRTTSFSHFSGTKDISAVIQNFPTPPTVLMSGNINDAVNTPITSANITSVLDRSAIEVNTGTTILNTPVSTTSTSSGYSFNLIPTDYLAPFGRYYTLKVNNSFPTEAVFVSTTGGQFKNNLITSGDIVGTSLYAIENVPADVHEPSTLTGNPVTIYDSLTEIRKELVKLTNVPWGTLVLNNLSAALLSTTNAGSLFIDGGVTAQAIVTDQLVSNSSILKVDLLPNAGYGAKLLSDGFYTSLYGVASWESGLGFSTFGPQLEIYRRVDPDILFPTPIVSLYPADAGTANYWPFIECSVAFEQYSVRTGILDNSIVVISINFGIPPANNTTYRIAYSIRGI